MLHNYVDSLYFPQRTDDDVSVHDQIIWNLHINGIDELLLFLGSNQTEVLVVREMQRVAFVEGCIAQNLYIWVLNWLAFISQLVEAAERFVICQTLFSRFFSLRAVPVVYACAGDNVPDDERAGTYVCTRVCHVTIT